MTKDFAFFTTRGKWNPIRISGAGKAAHMHICTHRARKIALLETLLEEFVIAFCQEKKLSRWNFLWNPLEQLKSWRFHEFLSGVGKDDFLAWTRWMSISLTLLASLNPQIIRRAALKSWKPWQLIKTRAQIFSDQEMDESCSSAEIFSSTIFQNDTDQVKQSHVYVRASTLP